jgi:hypothetical protein
MHARTHARTHVRTRARTTSKNDPTLRYYMGVFVTSKLFDNAIFGGIIISTVLLSVETYPPTTGPARQVACDLAC